MNTSNLHKKSIVIDGLNASKHTDLRVIKHLKQGGITAVNATVAAWHDRAFSFDAIHKLNTVIEKHKADASHVLSTSDIIRCKEENKVGYIFGFQGSSPIEKDIGLIKEYYDLGVRIIQLTYNKHDYVGSGCMEAVDRGLTDFGKKVIKELNRLGILIDLSHCGYKTTRQAIEYSELPVAFTHANPSFVCNSKRNKPEELFELLVKHGGVAGAVAVPALLTCDKSTTLGNYIDLIDKMVRLVGIDHVALGPDFMEYLGRETINAIFNGLSGEDRESFETSNVVVGFENASKFKNVTEGLIDWGYKAQEIQKILGINWMNLYQKVW